MLFLNFILFLTKSVFGFEVVATPRIVNGTRAAPGQFPFAVALLKSECCLACTGNLISDKFVLTAAHCIGQFVYVLAGDNSIFGTSEFRQLRNVSHTVQHPGFLYRPQAYDIGLVSVDSPFVLSEFVKPINLCDKIARTGEICTHAGWGSVQDHVHHFSNDLMYHKLTILGSRDCHKKMFFKGFLCAASSHSRPSYGDSGGPLICHGQLCGITSTRKIHGQKYNLSGNVPNSKDWILSNGTKGEAPYPLYVKKQFLLKLVLSNVIIVTAKCRAYDF